MTWQEMEPTANRFSTSYCKEGLKNVAAAEQSMDLKRGIDKQYKLL
jgi:hypothetical protein